MSKKSCYFKCNYEGQLYGFPPVTYTSYERYCKWKNILRKKDKDKDDHFIIHNFKLCGNHFEKHYFFANNRLTRHAVPTLIFGITLQQQELLCSFIDEHSKLIMGYHLNGEMVEEVIAKWETIAPQLNAVGPKKSYTAWAEYVYDIMSNLKAKEINWTKETWTPEMDAEPVTNSDDFTELELKILQLWHKEMKIQNSSDQLKINLKDENGVEYMIEVGDEDDTRDSDISNYWTAGDDASENEIVTFTLNMATGGQKPLLQAADIAPYETPKDPNTRCKCNQSGGQDQDEFDAFGKDIAHQLRIMPTQTALETQQLLASVLRSKRSKILNDSFLQH